jgi:hypothetical protein
MLQNQKEKQELAREMQRMRVVTTVTVRHLHSGEKETEQRFYATSAVNQFLTLNFKGLYWSRHGLNRPINIDRGKKSEFKKERKMNEASKQVPEPNLFVHTFKHNFKVKSLNQDDSYQDLEGNASNTYETNQFIQETEDDLLNKTRDKK